MPEDGEEHYFYDIYNAYDHYRFSKEDEDYASPCRKCSHEITKTADPDGYLENN
jgi:hypothetical protein